MKRGTWLGLLLMTSSAVVAAGNGRRAEEETVLELDFEPGGIKGHWQDDRATIVLGRNGSTVLRMDTRDSKGTWNGFLGIPAGVLHGGGDFVLSFDYESGGLSDADSFFFAFARSEALGYGADQWRQWTADEGESGRIEIPLTLPDSRDYGLTIGIHRKGVLAIDNLRIERRNGWKALGLAENRNVGTAAKPAHEHGCSDFRINPPSGEGGATLSLADFGAVTLESGKPIPEGTNQAALARALKACRKQKAARLIVPRGIYPINGAKGLAFERLQDFVFDGQGSRFVFSKIGQREGFRVHSLHRCVMENFEIDWDWDLRPLSTFVRVTGMTERSVDVQFLFGDDVPPEKFLARTFNPIDEQTRSPARGQAFNPQVEHVEKIGPRALRVHLRNRPSLKEGQAYRVRHYNYDKHAFQMRDNTHLSLRKVHIRSFPGMGYIVGGDQQYWELVDCRIVPPPERPRAITCTADGYHVNQSKGFQRLLRCDFGWMGDDCVNIHDTCVQGLTRLDARTLLLDDTVHWRQPFAVGDPVEMRNPDLSPAGWNARVTWLEYHQRSKTCKMSFDADLPAEVKRFGILFNRRYGSVHWELRDCKFHHNRARGAIVHAPNGTVENCLFSRNQHEAMRIETGCESRWKEGYGAQNLILRNNTFERCNDRGEHQGVAIYVNVYLPQGHSDYPVFRDLLFERNRFVDCPGPILDLHSFERVTVRGNSVLNLADLALKYPHRGLIRATRGRDLLVENNTWTGRVPRAAVEYNPDTTDHLALRGNRTK